ncbi:MAG: protein kinase [Polyangiaceae bacterium]
MTADDFPIESRFTLENRVGRGGSGEVFRGLDRETGATVAVKRLSANAEDPLVVDRFWREARLLAQVAHPNVVEYVAHGVDERGRPCLVVEWLEGEDLAHRQRRRRLTIAEALDVAHQAAVGLHALHRAGIVHRDVKPANLYLVGRDDSSIHVKLIDLGVARATSEATLTTVGNMVGTPFFMAPEQARGEERVTSRADQFALGAVLFELLTGRRAFTGDDVFAVLAKIVLSEPPRLADVMPGAPPELSALVQRAMAKNPEHRFGSMAEIADALATIVPWTPEADLAPISVKTRDEPTTRVAAMSSTWERRVITAVFAGFAPSPHDTDLQAFEALVAEHGASSFRTLGRRVIAVFGGARTTGDEAVRAARACIAAASRIPWVHLAIATGRALSGQTGLSGDLIERGVRVIEREPRPTSGAWPIRIDEATARLLTEHFIVEGPVDGRVLAAVRPAAAPPRTLVGKPTPCVGRDRELVTLDATFAECASEPVARAVLVTGPAGIGKSRLRYEMLARISRHESEPEVLLARGSPLTESSPFGLLAPALRRFAGIGGGEPPALQRKKLSERLGRHAPPGVVDPLAEIAWVPGIDTRHGDARPRDAMLSGDRMRAAWIDWLAAETAQRPMVIVIEDLHWGDAASVMYIDAALRALEGRPLFVVALARPEVNERFPSLWAGRNLQEIKLGPLTPKAAERLARAALGDAADAATIQRIVARGEGNAFYVEELIRAAAEGTGEALPDTVLGMVQARLDALGPETKKVLRAASVFGEVFWRGGVAALVGDATPVSGPLARLVEAEIVSQRPVPTFPGEDEHIFRHALVREAAYAMIPDVDRRAGHRTAGAWLERAGEADPALLGTHYERGGDLDRAAGFFLRAALGALAGNDFAGAVAHANRTLVLGESGPEGAEAPDPHGRRGRARLIQAEACRWAGDLTTAAQTGAEAASLLERGTTAWLHAMRETIAATGRLGHFDRVAELFEDVLATEPAEGAEGARIACLVPATAHLFYSGRGEQAARALARIEELERATPNLDPSVTARLHQLRALRSDLGGSTQDALAHHLAALAAFERAGDLRGACQTQSNVGFIHAQLGDFVLAEHALRRAQDGAQRMGLWTIYALADHNLGGVLAALGKLDEARIVEQRAVDAFTSSGDPRLEGACRVYLSRILLAKGDVEGALSEARRVVNHPASPAPAKSGALAALSLALLAAGRPEQAVTAAEQAAELLAQLGAIEDFEALIGVAHAEALAANGRIEEARRAVAVARRRIHDRAARLREPVRTRFLTAVPDNARCLGLALVWGEGDGGPV